MVLRLVRRLAQRRQNSLHVKHLRSARSQFIESLEDRRLMAVASPPNQALPLIQSPIAIESGLIDADPDADLVAISRSGLLSVALNDNRQAWREVANLDLNLGTVYGMTAGLINGDAYLDLVTIGTNSAQVLLADGAGHFTKGAILSAPAGGRFEPSDRDLTSGLIGLLNSDLLPDVALLDTARNQVVIYYATTAGQFAAPVSFATGGADPTCLAIGNVLGDTQTELIVGHRDGSLTFLTRTNMTDTTEWNIDPSATRRSSSPIRGLAAGDLDRDGDIDIAVSAETSAYILYRDPSRLVTPPITNADFEQGLSGWTFTTQGAAAGTTAGTVHALNGRVQLVENASLLTSLSQTIVIPPDPKSITFDIADLNLEYAGGAIPDAFELSLLASDNSSVVPTHRVGSTSFFNASGTSTGAPKIALASGVRFVGSRVTLDISSLAPGSRALLVIDLVGNPPGNSSTVTIEGIDISPSSIYSQTFTTTLLPGGFSRTRGIKIGDVDADSRADVVVVDSGSNSLLIFNGTETPEQYQRSTLVLTSLGGAPTAIALGAFDTQAAIDIAVTMTTASQLLTPLAPSAASSGVCLPMVDLERDALGMVIKSGTELTDQFAAWGISITGPAGSSARPVALNWAKSVNAATPSASSMGNVLVLASKSDGTKSSSSSYYGDGGHSDDDDDDHYGDDYNAWRLASGTLTFNFASPVMIDELRLLGIKTGSRAIIQALSSTGELLKSSTIEGTSTGGLQTARLDARRVARLTVQFQGSGSIAQLVFCRDIAAGSRIIIGGSTGQTGQVDEGSTYTLPLSSPLVAVKEWLINWGDGQTQTILGDPESVAHRYLDGPSQPTVYATARDAQGNIYVANLWPVKVNNVAPTLTLTGPDSIEGGLSYVLQLSSNDPGNDKLKRWIIDWGDGSQTSLTGDAISARHIYRNTSSQTVIRTLKITARDEDSSSGDAYIARPISVRVLPDTSRRLPTIDFERAADGSVIRAPLRLTDQFAALGITISSNAPAPRGPLIIDSSKPAWMARDIGTPGSSYSGPGSGRGGLRGQTGANSVAQRNVLVLASDVNASLPEDYEGGGSLVFHFATPVMLDELHLLDIDKSGSLVRLYTSDGSLISSTNIPVRGVNSFQILPLSASHVSRMEIILKGGGAIAQIVSVRATPVIARPESRFFVIDRDDFIYRYAATGSDIGDFRTYRAAEPRGIAADLDSNPLWVIAESGSSDTVLIYDSASEQLLGSWQPRGIVNPQGIATDGTDIWIVDGTSRKVFRYASAAARRSGTLSVTDSFSLTSSNTNPVDIVASGTSLWVVDATTDRVYQYSRNGSLTNSWVLDPANSDPAGIAIQPNMSDGIYVLDAVDKRVYSYASRTWTSSAPQPATSSFQLAKPNMLPVGLTDPGGQLAIGAIVNETLAASATTDWTFDAVSGQSIYINFQSLTDALGWELTDPNGNLVLAKSFSRAFGLDSGTLRLNTTGTYTLRLTAGAAETSYQFQIFDVPGPDVNAVTFGQIHIGQLDSPGRQDHWTFNGSSGSTYFLDFLSLDTVVGGDLIVEVRSPSGSIISTRTATRESSLDQSFTLTESGAWTIVMRASFDGSQLPSYSFQLWNVPPDDAGTIRFRLPVSGQVEVPGARDRWTFTGTANQEIFFDMQSLTGGDAHVQILAPDSTQLFDRTFSLASALDTQLTLSATGTYTIVIDGGGSANLNQYQFTLWDIPKSFVQTTLINTTLGGQTVPGQIVRYDFEATAGLPVLLDVIESASEALGVTITAPDGSLIADRVTRDKMLTLPASGTYQVTVGRSSPFFLDGYGPYSFRIQDRSSPQIGQPDNLGTKFYLAFPGNLRQPFAPNNPEFSLTITAPVNTSGTVQIPGINYSTSFTVTAGQSTRIVLPPEVEIIDSDVITSRGILVTSLNEVAVYGLDRMIESTDGFTALPIDAIGTDYYVLGYSNTIDYVVGGGTNLTIAATADNTNVTITPAVAVGARAANVPFTIRLNQGQAYTLHTSLPFLADLSGSRVVADKPIALFGGNTAARVPVNVAAADHLIEQLPPTNTWGNRFATLPLATRSGGDTFRVLAQQNNTQVRVNGQLIATLDAGKFIEYQQSESSLIESSAPVLVAQYSNGSAQDGVPSDPFMMLIPPIEQYLNDYTLSTPTVGININYANLIVTTSDVASVRLDGAPISGQFAPIGTTNLSAARVPISVGSHRFQADVPLGVSIYGFADFDSYGYFGGMSLGSIAAVGSLTISPASAVLPLGTLHTLTAMAVDQNGIPVRGVRIDFVIEGLTNENRFAITDSSGRASIQLQRDSVGLDRITAIVAGRTAIATVNWQATGPLITITSPTPGGQVLVGPRLITGVAKAGAAGASIVEVTVNGLRVTSVDSMGNFFAPVEILEGSQTFTIGTTNSLGLQASSTLSLVGVANTMSSVGASNSSDITSAAAVVWSSTTFNRQSNRLLADMRLVNMNPFPLDATVAARFDSITPTSVTLIAPDTSVTMGTAIGARPAMLFDSELPSQGLLTDALSDPILVSLDNPQRSRFTFDLSLIGRNNRPPRFISNPDLQAAVGTQYRTTLQAIDPDGSRLTYSLVSGPSNMAVNATSGLVAWTPLPTQVGSHPVTVKADDGRGGTALQRFTLIASVAPANRPPIITSAPTTATQPGASYRTTIRARDPDNDPLLFELLTGPAGMTIGSSSGTLAYDNATAGQYPVTVRVNDGRGGTATQSFQLRVGSGTAIASPTIQSTPAVTATAGQFYTYTVSAIDPQRSPLTWSLSRSPAGMLIDPVLGRITWRPTAADVGLQLVEVDVRNAQGGIATQTYSLVVAAAAPNSVPIFTSQPNLIATAGSSYAYNSSAADSDGDALVYSLVTFPTGMNINKTSGRVTWLPTTSQIGSHRVLIVATDAQGDKAYQQYQLSVRETNSAPQFTSTPPLTATVGTAYRYDAIAFDSADEVTYSLVTGPTGLLIDSRTGIVTYVPVASQSGNQSVTLKATDDRGLSATQTFTLVVDDDLIPPSVTITYSRNNIAPGESVRIQVAAFDNSGVNSVTLTIDGRPQTLDASRGMTFTPTKPGIPQMVATASDRRGNVRTVKADPPLRVIDPNDTQPPLIDVTTPAPGQMLTYLTDVIGTITDENLEYYELAVSPAGKNQWKTISRREFVASPGIDGITAGLLGNFDATLLANDTYELRILAQDVSGNQRTLTVELSVEGGAKLGNYQFTASQNYCGCGIQYSDLEIPLAGIPIRITRSYDSLDSGYIGDFGYGWRMQIASPRINEAVRVSASEAAGGGPLVANPFRQGTRVYLNAPDGRRVGFTFDPVPVGGLLGAVWTPQFVPDPGVEMELEVDPVSLSQRSDGTFGLYLFDLPYNPDTYTLVTRDQMRYRYDQFADIQLKSITDRNGVELTFDERGIHSSTGAEILWTRDTQGRITEIIDPAGNRLKYSYDARGDLTRFENQIGDVTTMAYLDDPAHYLRSVVDPHGNEVLKLTYDAAGRVSGVADALGNSTRQTYDLSNNREIISDRMGAETTIEFDDRGNITLVQDALGRTVRTEYDQRDRAITVTDARGLITRMSYDDRSNVTQVIDAAGQVWRAEYNSSNDLVSRTNPLGQIELMQYDARGNVTRSTAIDGGVSTMQYDSQGRLTSLRDALDQLYQFEYAGFDQPTKMIHPDGTARELVQDAMGRSQSFRDETGSFIQFVQDAAGRVTEIIAPDGARSTLDYDHDRLISKTDALGRVSRYEYDDKGRLIAEFAPQRLQPGNVAAATTTRLSSTPFMAADQPTLLPMRALVYDENDRIVRETDELGRTTIYEHNLVGDLLSITDPLNRVMTFTYDPAGNLLSITDPIGRVDTLSYDELNRVGTLTDPAGGLWQTGYSETGYVISQTDANQATTGYEYAYGHLARATNALGQVVEYTHSFLGNLLTSKDERGFITRFAYDSRNRLTSRTDPTGATETWKYDEFGSVIEYVDQAGTKTTNDYDDRHRLVRSVSPAGGETLYAYDAVGNLIQVTDPLGRITRYEYDDRDRLIRSIDANSGVTSFAYDAVGNLLSLTDPLGNVTRWEYDALDRVVAHIDPLGAISTIVYDPAGNIQSATDRLGRTKTYSYDVLDRLNREVWKSAAGEVVDSRGFTYDPVGNLLTAHDSDSQLSYTYDALSQLTSASNAGTVGVLSVNLSYGYDAAGNRSRVSDNFGVAVNSTYNSRNQLASRSWTGLGGVGGTTSARVDMAYNARGQLTGLNRFTSELSIAPTSKAAIAYDSAGRVSQIRNTNAVDAVIASYDTAWDLADQLVNWTINGRASTLSYDATGQLTNVSRGTNSSAEAYSYDLNGNRQDPGRTVGANNRLLADARFDYQYDAEGNRTGQVERATGRVTTFVYDHDNQLIAATTRARSGELISEVSYRYDVLGRRIARTADVDGAGPAAATTEYYVYDGDEVWLDASASGQITARYLSGDGIDDLIARYRATDGLSWYAIDHLGSVRAILDASGNVIATVDYDSFGNILTTTGNPSSLDRFLFNGRDFDPLIAQYHYRTRQYDPASGIFTTEDTIGFWSGDTNLARYTNNTPVSARDPGGTMALVEDIFTVNFGQRVALAGAGAAIGGIGGFLCGFLETWYLNRDQPDAYQNAFRTGVATAIVSSQIGSAIGYFGAGGPVSAYIAGLFSNALAFWTVYDTNGRLDVSIIRAGCIILGARIGSGIVSGRTAPQVRPSTTSATAQISAVGRGINGHKITSRLAAEIEGAVNQALRLLEIGSTGGTRWGKIYQGTRGSGKGIEALAKGNAVQQIAQNLLAKNSYFVEYGVIFNRGHVLGLRNANGNLLRPDFQVPLSGGRVGILDLTTPGQAPKIFKYSDPGTGPLVPALINIVY